MGLVKCIKTSIDPYSIIQSRLTALKILCSPPNHISPALRMLTTTSLFTVSIVLPVPKCYTVGIIQIITYNSDNYINHVEHWTPCTCFITESLYSGYLHPFPPTLTPASGKHKSDCLFYKFVCLSINDL